MNNLHPIFAECCAEEPTTYSIDEPFQVDGYLCATDRRIVVRMKHAGRDTPKGPSLSGLPWCGEIGKYDCDPTALPEVSYAGFTTCAECKGTKKVKCSVCKGSAKGECECPDCGANHECGECDGIGKVPCGNCNDDGKAWATVAAVDVHDGYGLGDRYIDLLRRHHAKVYLPVSRNRDAPVYFTIAGGIEGLVVHMALKAPASPSAVGAEVGR